MRIVTALALVLLSVTNGPAFAQGRSDPLQSACSSGEPWFLPAAPANGETSILVVAGANPAIRIRLCNCTPKEGGETFIRVNPNTSVPNPIKGAAPAGKMEATSSATIATQLYVGSCLEAMGNNVTIRNTLPKDQRGTYQVR
jgi:hypothetical protein